MAAKGALLRIALEIISMLGYSKGFSHSDLGTTSDFDVHLSSLSHRWNGNADTGRSATNDIASGICNRRKWGSTSFCAAASLDG